MTVKIAVIIFLFAFILNVLGDFNLTIVHISDFHSHWHEFDEHKHECSNEDSRAGNCYGGFARLLTFVNEIRRKEKNVLVLSSGEFFLGKSLYALHGRRLAHSLLPKLELDAMSLSNHDLDSGILDLSSFLYAMKFPVLCVNMVARNTSFLYSRVNKSVVLDVNGTKVGIVGYIHRHALKKSRNAVSIKFLPEIPALQEEVSRLESEGVNKIIALGHAGYFTDLEIAKNVKGVDIVMGGDSDIMLFDPGHDDLKKVGNIHGNYPRVHHQEPKTADDPSLVNRTLVLHIPQHGMYVGVLRATFDDGGKIIHESGEPVLLDKSVPQDKATVDFLEWATGALHETNEHRRLPHEAEVLGVTENHLDGDRRRCRMQECSLGNFIADAMLHEYTFHHRNNSDHKSEVEKWGPIDALVYNSGVILKSIKPGYITIREIIKSLYLGSFVTRAYMSGQQVLDMMEHSVKHYDPTGVTAPGSFLQIAGLRVEYDLSKPPGRRVRSLRIRCRDCDDDNTYNPLVHYKTYIIGMPNFMYKGRDGFYDFEDFDSRDFGQFDAELLIEHLRRIYAVVPKIDGRIKFYQSETQSNDAFIPPLLFGEPASEYNKFNGEFGDSENEQSSETDRWNEANNLDTTDDTVEIKIDKDENKSFSSVKEERPEHDNNSYTSFGSESSLEKLNISIENNIYNNDSRQATPNFKNVDLSDDDTLHIIENDIDDLNHRVSNGFDLATERKNNESGEAKSHNPAYLSEIPTNHSDESKEIGETYQNPSIQEVKSFKNNSNDIYETSKDENVSTSLPKEYSKAEILLDSIINNQTKILNSSKFTDVAKILLNSTPETLNSSLETIANKFPNSPESSNLLEKISHNLTKRSVEDWMNDTENMEHFYEFKNNISNLIENLDQIHKNNSSVGSSDLVFNEIQDSSLESIVEKAFAELMKYILKNDVLNDLFKDQNELMNITANITTSNSTYLI